MYFFGFIEAFDMLKKELRQPWNALTRQFSLLPREKYERWCNNIVCVDQVMWCLQ